MSEYEAVSHRAAASNLMVCGVLFSALATDPMR